MDWKDEMKECHLTYRRLKKMKIKININILKTIIWFFVLIPIFNYYFPKPVSYWPIIIISQTLISIGMSSKIIIH